MGRGGKDKKNGELLLLLLPSLHRHVIHASQRHNGSAVAFYYFFFFRHLFGLGGRGSPLVCTLPCFWLFFILCFYRNTHEYLIIRPAPGDSAGQRSMRKERKRKKEHPSAKKEDVHQLTRDCHRSP
ncbi:hypothetical protein F4804DRAFT_294042 [Jackrogersella minutella]|nr:hypothetical protein F4804DRAFT_294042 [Jackrogersella minutella]